MLGTVWSSGPLLLPSGPSHGPAWTLLAHSDVLCALSAHRQVVAVEEVGGGGVVLISLSLPLCVGKAGRERASEEDTAMSLCEARTPGEMFCTVGVFLGMSSTCAGAAGWCVKCTPPGRQLGRCDVRPHTWDVCVGGVEMLGGSAISGSLFKCLTAITARWLSKPLCLVSTQLALCIKSRYDIKPPLYDTAVLFLPEPSVCLSPSTATFNGQYQILMMSDGRQKWRKRKEVSWEELISLFCPSAPSSPPLPSAFLLALLNPPPPPSISALSPPASSRLPPSLPPSSCHLPSKSVAVSSAPPPPPPPPLPPLQAPLVDAALWITAVWPSGSSPAMLDA